MEKREEAIGCRFDAYCKRVLKNELVDAIRAYAKERELEVTFSDLSSKEKRQLQTLDTYHPDRRVFLVRGVAVEIADSDLAQGLSALSEQQREIVILSYLLDLSDAAIADLMGMNRSTVQYQRTRTLNLLQEIIKGGQL